LPTSPQTKLQGGHPQRKHRQKLEEGRNQRVYVPDYPGKMRGKKKIVKGGPTGIMQGHESVDKEKGAKQQKLQRRETKVGNGRKLKLKRPALKK